MNHRLTDEELTWTIWKFPIEFKNLSPQGEFEIEMPEKSDIIAVDRQDGTGAIWALVDPDSPPKPRNFAVVGTGRPIFKPKPGYEVTPVGSWMAPPFVWHLFEVVALTVEELGGQE